MAPRQSSGMSQEAHAFRERVFAFAFVFWYNILMEQTLTAKLKLDVPACDRQILLDTMDVYRAACNCVSEYIFKTRILSRVHIHDVLYHEIRSRFGLRSQMAESVILTVIARYRTILTNQKRWIRPSFKKPQVDLVWNRDYSLPGDRSLFSVNTVRGRIRVPFFAKGVCLDGRFGTARLVCRHGKFFLHVPVTKDIDVLRMDDVTNVVGVDRGIRFLAASYDSGGKTTFFDGAAVKQRRAHYKDLRRQLQQVGTPSSRRRLKAIGQRENRWMRDVNHQVSKALTEQNPEGTMFVIEDLKGVRAATERVRTRARYVSVSWAYYDLEQKLTYKALKNRQLVVKADPAYTSQSCPKCGHTERTNRDKRRHLFCCRCCGYSSNDDRIAAMNLHRMGIDMLVPDAVAEEYTPQQG